MRAGEKHTTPVSPGLAKIERKTIVSQVMEKVRQLIASGQYKSGDRIPTEGELSAQLGIGRSSIREAIKVFNYLGVLDSRTAKGTYVCDRGNISAEALTWSILLGRDDYQDLIDTRGAIETWSIVLLTERFSRDPASIADTLKTLDQQLEKMRRTVASGDEDLVTDTDYDFHAAIIAASGNRLFIAVYEVLRSFMREEIEKSRKVLRDASTIIAEHAQFLDAIRSGDTLVAQRTVATHIAGIKQRLGSSRP